MSTTKIDNVSQKHDISMENLSSTLFTVSETMNPTIRLEYIFKDEIDKEALEKAVKLLEKRFFYLKRRYKAGFWKIKYVENDLPWVIKNTDQPVDIMCAENNYHIIAFSYWEKMIAIDCSHGDFDGTGLFALMNALVQIYCRIKYDENIKIKGILDVDDEISEKEYIHPYYALSQENVTADENEDKKENAAPDNFNIEKDGCVHDHRRREFRLMLKQEEVIKYCSSYDGSPATSFALILAKAIHAVHPESDKNISMYVPCNIRNIIGAEMSHHSLISNVSIDFDKRLWNKDFELQGTAFRGKVIADTRDEVLLPKIIKQAKSNLAMSKIRPAALLRRLVPGLATKVTESITASVSYTGRSQLGELEKYIDAMYIGADPCGIGILIEVAAPGDKFFLTFAQNWYEDVYFKAFCEELQSLGMEYKIVYDGEMKAAKIKVFK